MNRYQIAGVEHTPTGVIIKCPMLDDPVGEWVRYTDVADVVKAEREACAKVCEGFSKRDDDMGAIIASALRARGEE